MKTLLNKTLAIVVIASLIFSCEGPEGPAGQDGQDGAAGSAGASALVSVTAEAAGTNCATGGFKIEVGIDANSNSTLDASEISSTSYICAGASALIATTAEAAGSNCENGGFKVESGLDDNGDGTLDAAEVDETVYLCNGVDFTIPELEPLTSSLVDANLVFDVNTADFPNAQVEMIMTSKDILPSDSAFVYGSFTDGMDLYETEESGVYSLIVNQEADYGQSRIYLNSDLQPFKGEVIADAFSTAFTAQCSGSGIYPEVHGFGPYYLSGGEWGGNAKGVYVIDPNKPSDLKGFAQRSANMGEWSTENAVALSAAAYSETVVIIGDDDSNNTYPEGHLGMYVGPRGDLFNGDLYVLRGKDTTEGFKDGSLKFEMGMAEGTAYDVEWVEMTQRTQAELNTEAIDSVVIGFQRIEDIDWQRGTATDNRKVFFVTTGRYRSGEGGSELSANTTAMRGTTFGRIYMLEMNDSDPTGDAQITCILDGDDPNSVAWGFNSPDNLLVTEGYAYIQEDPNGYWDDGITVNGTASAATQWPKIYQYNIMTGELKTLITADQAAAGVQDVYTDDSPWEFTGMIEVSRVIGSSEPVFLCGVQVHDWGEDSGIVDARADGKRFFDSRMIPEGQAGKEGSFLFKITGIE